MPDISKCTGDDCPIKDQCYRYRSISSNQRQSYIAIPPYKDGNCEAFWPLEKGMRIIPNDKHKE